MQNSKELDLQTYKLTYLLKEFTGCIVAQHKMITNLQNIFITPCFIRAKTFFPQTNPFK